MGKHIDLELVDKAFLMYSAGIKAADIARELKVTPNCVNGWRNRFNWDQRTDRTESIVDKITETVKELSTTTDNSPQDIAEHIKNALSDALLVHKLRPRTWKDVIDTLTFLSRDIPKGISNGKPKEGAAVAKDITNVDTDELDKNIEELHEILNKEDEAIIIEKGSVVH